MVRAIATLDKKHGIFDRNYKPEKKERVNAFTVQEIDNSDDFFTGLADIYRGLNAKHAPRMEF